MAGARGVRGEVKRTPPSSDSPSVSSSLHCCSGEAAAASRCMSASRPPGRSGKSPDGSPSDGTSPLLSPGRQSCAHAAVAAAGPGTATPSVSSAPAASSGSRHAMPRETARRSSRLPVRPRSSRALTPAALRSSVGGSGVASSVSTGRFLTRRGRGGVFSWSSAGAVEEEDLCTWCARIQIGRPTHPPSAPHPGTNPPLKPRQSARPSPPASCVRPHVGGCALAEPAPRRGRESGGIAGGGRT